MKVAIVKLSALGDVIHALPVARALKAARPDARLTWVVETRQAGILRDHPDLDALVSVDTRRWRHLIRSPRGAADVLREIVELRRRLGAARFDAALDLQGLIKSGFLTAATRAPLRIGFAPSRCREPLNALFTNRRVTPGPSARHVVEQYCALLEPLGIRDVTPAFTLPVDPHAEAHTDELLAVEDLKPGDGIVALIPGAGRAHKRWPIVHFRSLADRLWADAGVRSLVLWGPGEERLARLIASGLAARPVMAPPTDLAALAALLRRCAVVVGGDTGPLHLGAALGTPAVGLFGPTRAERNRPYGPRGRALQSPDGAMDSIAPSAVYDAVVEFVA